MSNFSRSAIRVLKQLCAGSLLALTCCLLGLPSNARTTPTKLQLARSAAQRDAKDFEKLNAYPSKIQTAVLTYSTRPEPVNLSECFATRRVADDLRIQEQAILADRLLARHVPIEKIQQAIDRRYSGYLGVKKGTRTDYESQVGERSNTSQIIDTMPERIKSPNSSRN
jgi:hypothetical protein